MAEASSRTSPLQAASGAAAGGLALLWLWVFGPDWRMAGAAALAAVGLAVAAWTLAAPARWLSAFTVLTLLTPPVGDFHPAMAAVPLGLAGLARLRLRLAGFAAASLWLWTMMLLSLGPALALAGWRTAAAGFARCCLFAVALAAFLAARECLEPRRWLRLLAVSTVLLAGLACLDFLFQWQPLAPFSSQYVWAGGEQFRRAQGFFYDAGQLGSFCVFGLLGALLLLVRRAAREALGIPRSWVIAGSLPLATALTLSFSRASALALAVGLLAAAPDRSMLKLAGAAAGAVVAGLAACLAVAPSYTAGFLSRFAATLSLAVTNPVQALGERWNSWSYLLHFLGEHPATLLLGVGYTTLPYSDVAGRPVIADNMYLSLLMETGLGGLLAVGALLAAALWMGRRGMCSADALTSFLGAWTLAFWAATTVQMAWVDLLTYWRVLPVYFVVVALLERRLSEEAPCAS